MLLFSVVEWLKSIRVWIKFIKVILSYLSFGIYSATFDFIDVLFVVFLGVERI